MCYPNCAAARLTRTPRDAQHTAARKNDAVLIEKLQTFGFDINSRDTKRGGTVIHAAVYADCNNAAKKILELGADTANFCSPVRPSRTPLVAHLAGC